MRQNLPAPDTDEEIEIFLLDMRSTGLACGLRDGSMSSPERARIAMQIGKAFQQALRGRAREQSGEQRVFLCACHFDLIDIAGRILHPVWSRLSPYHNELALAERRLDIG